MDVDLLQLAHDLSKRYCAPYVPRGVKLIVIVYDDEGVGYVSTGPSHEMAVVLQHLAQKKAN